MHSRWFVARVDVGCTAAGDLSGGALAKGQDQAAQPGAVIEQSWRVNGRCSAHRGPPCRRSFCSSVQKAEEASIGISRALYRRACRIARNRLQVTARTNFGDRRSRMMRLAPVLRFAARLELHRLDVRA